MQSRWGPQLYHLPGRAAHAVAFFLALLGVWSTFTARKSFKLAGRWSSRRALHFVGLAFFVASCWLPAAGLYWGWFRAWMASPLGACYVAMLPVPCYFEAVDRIPWLHAVRNSVFMSTTAAAPPFSITASKPVNAVKLVNST